MGFASAELEKLYQDQQRESLARTDWVGMAMQTVLWTVGLYVITYRKIVPSAATLGPFSLQAETVVALNALATLVAFRCPPAYRRRRTAAIAAFRLSSLLWPSTLSVLQAMPAGSAASSLLLTLTISSAAPASVHLAVGQQLPLALAAALTLARAASYMADHRRMCRLPYVLGARPEVAFGRIHSFVGAYLPLGSMLGADAEAAPLSPAQQCCALFAFLELAVALPTLWALHVLDQVARARFLAGAARRQPGLWRRERFAYDPRSSVARLLAALPAAAAAAWGAALLAGMYS